MNPWVIIVPLVLAAAIVPAVVGRFRLGKATADVRWLVGAAAVLCTVTAGSAARGTFIGDLVRTVGDLSTWTQLAAGVLFVGTVLVALLAVVPDRLVAYPADQAAAVAGFFAPILLPYAQWGVGRAGTSVLAFLTQLGEPIARAVTG